MQKLKKIIFKVTDENYGTPYPYIKDGTILIIYQNGEAGFGKYHMATLENPFPTFSHPKNNKMLSLLALKIIGNDDQDHLNSDVSLHFVCPEEYLDKLMW